MMYDQLIVLDCMDKVISIATKHIGYTGYSKIPISDAVRIMEILKKAIHHTSGDTAIRIYSIRKMVRSTIGPIAMINIVDQIINECKAVKEMIVQK